MAVFSPLQMSKFRLIVVLAFLVVLAVLAGGCSSGKKVEVPILVQSLPANDPDTPVDFYWSTRSLENWLKLPGNLKKSPDMARAGMVDSHKLWENIKDSRKHSKVADLVVDGKLNKNHPREWLLLELGIEARNLGAHGVVVNSMKVVRLTGHARRDKNEAMFTDSGTANVRVYAQAIRYE